MSDATKKGLMYLKLEMKKSDLESASVRYLNKQKESMMEKWIEIFGSPKVRETTWPFILLTFQPLLYLSNNC